MLRTTWTVCALMAGFALVGAVSAADKKVKSNQMVKGTIKSVDASTNVLIVDQQVKSEKVQRELSILPTTEFEITVDGKTSEYNGKEGLQHLVGKEGAMVQVKCDKDVNVLKVTVKVGKK